MAQKQKIKESTSLLPQRHIHIETTSLLHSYFNCHNINLLAGWLVGRLASLFSTKIGYITITFQPRCLCLFVQQ